MSPSGNPGVGDPAHYGGVITEASGPASTSCPQVQDVVKCQMGVCRADESEDSPDSCKNGQLQILVSEQTPPAIGSFPSASHLRWGGNSLGFNSGSAVDLGWRWANPPPSASSLQV